MVFDQLLSQLKTSEEEINPILKKPLFQRIIYEQKNSTKTIVIFTPWHITKNKMQILRKNILRAGHSCIIYDIDSSVLSANVEQTKNAYRDLQITIQEDLKSVRKEHHLPPYTLIGVSLSCVNAVMISTYNDDVEGVVLIAPSNSLSEALWQSLRTKHLKEHILAQNIDLPQLKKIWEHLNLINYVTGLKNKKIHIYAAKKDLIIPSTQTKKLVAAMKKEGVSVTFTMKNHLGHYGIIARYLFYPDFLQNL